MDMNTSLMNWAIPLPQIFTMDKVTMVFFTKNGFLMDNF